MRMTLNNAIDRVEQMAFDLAKSGDLEKANECNQIFWWLRQLKLFREKYSKGDPGYWDRCDQMETEYDG